MYPEWAISLQKYSYYGDVVCVLNALFLRKCFKAYKILTIRVKVGNEQLRLAKTLVT